ncbi:prolyl oligopeptidase family serine peptidase [Pandoraea fibrosis]|uniref:Prolyl oligopeptidase family serine peptidase n=1 Tax=Pandoraea fibrosis TaxID=1891094 RepID=A0ABX6HP39_9BURK|nr:CocE/NonD family hydrolase [Pandoraea fibrosis]QHE93855.1 prolyl oligopeptidase family serine peptidase [Pandoraea fibrosis]QHF12583.1 prolyl oligopeptidase family serine peptidase [Pandoraea fibrosis]
MTRLIARSRFCAGTLCALLLTTPFCGASTAMAASDDAATEAGTPAPAAAADPTPEIVSIVVSGAGTFGGDVAMHTEVYRPVGNGPFPVLIFEHGRASDALVRAKLSQPIPKGHVRYWLAKGFAIVAPVRVGYGATGGPDRENSGASFDMQGRCTRRPDFEKLSKVTAQANLAAVKWVRAQPWADKDRIVLEGRSVGGFTTVATAATNPPGVMGYINFSGGAGGMPERAPGHSCDPEQMKTVYGEFGKTTKIPGLWLYAHNDQYWGPDAPRQWFDAFAAAGSPAQFVHTEDLPGHDGHLLLTYGGKMWSRSVDAFVRQLGF